MSTSTMTAEEFIDTLTGREEDAIEKHMGFDFYQAAEAGKNVKLLRAAVFVAELRGGLTTPQALDAAQDMPTKALNVYFADTPADPDPDDPDSESGKEDSEPQRPQTT